MTVFAEVAINAPLRAGDKTFTFSVPVALERRVTIGIPVRVPFGKQTTSGYVVGLSPTAGREVKPVAALDERLPVLPSDLVTLAAWMADHYVCSVGEAIDAMLPPKAQSARRSPLPAPPPNPASQREQEKEVDASGNGAGVVDLLTAESAARIVIIGEDARFEAYTGALLWALQHGRGAIALEPEFAQAERLAAWIERKIGVSVALYHGAQSDPERRKLWQRIASGEFKVVAGTRVAVFAPLADVGLIIVDHEEDTSYKEERVPRYHVRAIAETRARIAQAALVWGSPTPSLEVVREVEEGRAARLTFPPADRPTIALSDVRSETGPLGGLFGRRLYQALARTLPRGRALLYVPRRGYADFLLCHECGAVTRCPRCGVAMTYHVAERHLACHLCGAVEPAPDICRVCGGTHIRPHGIGTERVEAAARKLFRGTLVLRLDAEAAPDEASQQKIWQHFDRKGGLLIGTQLLVKGVGQVRAPVVGAIGVDASLHLPDFRAAERTYQVLSQLAALAQQEMIVQTFAPTHPALTALVKADTAKFFSDELAARRKFGYPPYVVLINLIVTGQDQQAAGDTARALADGLAADGEVLGPSPAPLPRIRGRFRWQILVKERDDMRARPRLRTLLTQMDLPRTIKVNVDVDPVDLL
ncbi:MAG TPA: primosomal protein N' [bacterium]|nr:primosomal protein N' [bacterium]